MPDVCLHPGASELFLSELVQIQKKAKFSTMFPAFGPLENFRLVRFQFVERLEPYTHWYSVVVVCHCTSSKMACQELMLKFICLLVSENIGEMAELVRS